MTRPDETMARRERLLAEYFAGTLPPADERELVDAMAADEAFAREAQAYYRQNRLLETIFHVSEDRSFVDRPLACAGYSDQRIEFADRVLDHTRAPRRLRIFWSAGLAAAAALLVTAGAVLHFGLQPPASGPVALARITSVGPDVQVLCAGARGVAAVGMILRPGDEIETRLGQVAVLGYDGEATQVSVEESTCVRIGMAGPGKQLHLPAGSLRIQAAPQPGRAPLVVISPHARAEVVGTQFRVTVGSENTVLDVYQGLVRFSAIDRGSPIDVAAGSSASTAPGRAPALRRLPAAGSSWKNVRYVPGRVLYETAFDQGLDDWDVVQVDFVATAGLSRVAGDLEKKAVRVDRVNLNGGAITCLVAAVTGPGAPAIGIRLKHRVQTPAYSVEWHMRQGAPRTHVSTVCPGMKRVVSEIQKYSAVEVPIPEWFTRRMEFVPPTVGEISDFAVSSYFIKDRLARQMIVEYGEPQGTVMFVVIEGSALVDRVVIRELVPEPESVNQTAAKAAQEGQ